MKKYFLSFVAISGLLFTAGCGGGVMVGGVGYGKNQTSATDRLVYEKKLANGNTLMTGYKDADASWGCKIIYKEAVDDGFARVKSSFNFGGVRGFMADRAVEYVNNNPGSNINYVYIDVANEIYIMGIPKYLRENFVHYYSCKNPPDKHLNPFKD